MTQKLRWIAAAGGLLAVAVPAVPAHAVQFASPSFVEQLTNPTSTAFADFDGDGQLDLATASTGGVEVRRNETPKRSGTPAFAKTSLVVPMGGGGRPNVVVARDLNGDDRPDLVAANAAGPTGSAVTVRRNVTAPGGPITFAQDVEPTPAPAGFTAEELALLELNNDGLVDIAYSDGVTGALYVMRNESRQQGPAARTDFGTPVLVRTFGERITDITAAHIDTTPGFSNPELVVSRTGGTVSFFVNRSTGGGALTFDAAKDEPSGLTPLNGVAAADIDDDGREDVVGAGGTLGQGGFAVLRNSAGSQAAPDLLDAQRVANARSMTDVVIANVNADSDATDLVGSREDGFATVALNAGGLSFPAESTTDHDAGGNDGTSQVFAGELNGDDDLDVAVLDPGADRVAVALQSPEVRPTPNRIFRYIEDLAPEAVDPGLTVFAPGGTTQLQGATVRVSAGVPGDVLALPAREGLSSSYDPSKRLLTITGTAPVAAYEAALRSVVFSAPGDAPAAGNRSVVFSVRSEVASAEVGVRGVVEAINDAPGAVLSGPSGFLVRSTSAPVDGGIDIADPDSGTLRRASFSITKGFQGGDDRLLFRNDGTYTEERNGGTLTISANKPIAEWRRALRSVEFQTIGTSLDAREITIRLTDGEALEGPPVVRTLAFAPVNVAAPSLSGSAVAGQTVTASPGEWRGSAPITFAYRWQRCSAAGCVDIPGATDRSYVVTAADGGSRLRAVVTADNPAPGEEVVTTPQSAVVPAVIGSPVRPASAGGGGSTLPRVFGITGRALRDGRIRLTVRAPRAGRLDVAKLVRLRRTQLTASRTPLRAGTTTITLRPTAAVRALVRARGQATLNLRVTYRPRGGAVVRRAVRVVVRRTVVDRVQALADGRVRLTVKAPYAGRLSIARVRSGRTTVLAARSVAVRRGTTRVTLPTTAAAKRLVRSRGTLRLTLRATYRPARRIASRETAAVTLRRR